MRIYIWSFPLLILIILETTALAQKSSLTYKPDLQNEELKNNNPETKSSTNKEITINWFARSVTFIDYIFKKKRSYYTQAIASGLAINYKKGMIEFGAAINQMNFHAYFAALCYTLDVKKIDENWIRIFSGFGEIAVLPEQQSNPDQWIYTVGLVAILARPYKWGTPALALTAGGAYSINELNLNIRALFNLAIPIF